MDLAAKTDEGWEDKKRGTWPTDTGTDTHSHSTLARRLAHGTSGHAAFVPHATASYWTCTVHGVIDGNRTAKKNNSHVQRQTGRQTGRQYQAWVGYGRHEVSLGTCRRWEDWGETLLRGDMDRVGMRERGARPRREGTMRESAMGRGTGARARAAAAEGSVGRVKGRGQGVGVGVGGRESMSAGGHGDKEGQEAWHSKPNVVLAQWGVVCGQWWVVGGVWVCVVLCRGRGRPAALQHSRRNGDLCTPVPARPDRRPRLLWPSHSCTATVGGICSGYL